MTIFSRGTLKQAFPKNPRIVAEFEKLDAFLEAVDANGQTVSEIVSQLSDQVGSGFDPGSVFTALSNIPNRVGAVEFTNDGLASVRPIDGADPASLLSRGGAYSVLVGIGGTGTTSQRPVLPLGAFSIYNDTTLGKPIFFLGSGWVDATGAAV